MAGELVGEARPDLEVDHFPRRDVAGARDQGDQEADRAGAAERQRAALLFAVGADPEEYRQERRHNPGVADDRAVVEADAVEQRQREEHHRARHRAGNRTESEDRFLHHAGRLSAAGRSVVIPSGDFAANRQKSSVQGMRPAARAASTALIRRLTPSLSITRPACVFTVFSLTKSVAAISRVLRPRAISCRISNSRGVIASSRNRDWLTANGSAAEAAAGTSLITTRSRRPVMVSPSQMPAPAKSAAISPP